ncbi:MAG: hypothetical protein EBV32_05075, partial [Proteobacteria bacterium]|nr:hypothetical protein [Candidatus Fonsibacter lacus]NBP60419.1 hypothetical protein [Pseudomonadota bacterium]
MALAADGGGLELAQAAPHVATARREARREAVAVRLGCGLPRRAHRRLARSDLAEGVDEGVVDLGLHDVGHLTEVSASALEPTELLQRVVGEDDGCARDAPDRGHGECRSLVDLAETSETSDRDDGHGSLLGWRRRRLRGPA